MSLCETEYILRYSGADFVYSQTRVIMNSWDNHKDSASVPNVIMDD